MSKNDFLYTLRDELPEDFSESLREQLKQLEQEPIVESRPRVTDERGRQTDSSRWLLAVASFAVLMAGLVFLLSTERQNDVAMNIATLPPTISNHGDLNPETVSQLTPITTLGNGVARDMMLSDDGDTLVLTGYGVINLHDANNLHAEPRRIVMDGFIRLLDVTDDNMVYGMISNREQGYASLYEIDGNTGEIREMMQMPYAAFIYKEQLSLAGNRLAIIVCIPDDPENTIRCLSEDYQLQVYDITTGELGISIPVTSTRNIPMDISEDGRTLIYSDFIGEYDTSAVHLYSVDLMNGQSEVLLTRELPIQYNWIRFSPDDEALLLHSNDRLVQYPLSLLINAETPVDFGDDSIAERSETQFLNGFVEESNFHPERAQLVAKGSSAFQVYDINTQHTEYQQTQVELRRLYHWAILPDGENFIGLDESGVVMRYSFPDAEVQDTLYRYDGQMPHGFAFRDDATMLTFTELPYFGTQIRQWSLDDDAPMSMPFTGSGTEPIIAHDVAMSPNGRYMYYELVQYTVGYQVNSRKWIYDFEMDSAYEVNNFYGNWDTQFLDDETLLGISGNQGYLYDVAGRIADNEENSEDVTVFDVSEDYMTNIWWSIADTIVVASSGFVDNNAITMVTLACVAPEQFQSSTSIDECDGVITLWDARTGQTLYKLRDEAWDSAVTMSLSGDGETLFVGTCEPDEAIQWFSCHAIYVYDLSTIEYDADSEEVPVIDVEAIAQLTDLPHEVYDITVQPDSEGQELIAVSGVSLTTFVTLDERNRIEQHATLPMSEVTFSPDGDLAFVTDRQGRIEIWGVPPANRSTVDAEEADSSLRLTTRPEITSDTIGMTETIASYENGLAFRFALSPDERTLAIGTSSGIYLHDAYDLNVEPQFIGQPRDGAGYYLDYSDNGDLFVISVDRFTDEVLAHVYRAETGQFDLLYEASIPDITYIVQGVDISPDGQTLMLATCMNESGIYIENSQSFCIGGGMARIELINFADTSQVEVIEPQRTSNAVVAMPEDWSYLAYFSDGDIYLRDMLNPSDVRPVIEMPVFDVDNFYMGSDLFNIYFTPDGSEIGVVLASNGQFESWTVDELTSVDVSSPDAFRVDGSPVPDVGAFNIVFHPQTQDRLIARSDSITVRDTNGERLTEFRSVNQPRDMIVSADGERVYVLNETGVIQVFHWDSRLVMNMITDYTLTSSMMLESSRDGRLWVSYTSGGTDGISSIWEITDDGITRQNLLPEDDITNPVKRATISPDNRYIAYVEGTYISVYDRQQDEHRRLDVVLGVVDITFADNGELVAIVSERGAGVRKVYDAEMLVTGDVPYPYLGEPIEEMGTLNSTPRITDEFMSFTMSSNGEMMAVHQCNGGMPDAYWYGCIRAEEAVVVLDGASTEPVATLDFFDDTIRFNQMALTHDGAYLAISYCEDSSPDDWDCEANMSEVALYSVEALRAGDLTPFAVIDNVDAWSTNKGLRLHRQSDGTFLVMVSRWEEVSDDLLEIITYVWSVTDDGTSSLVYDDNVSRLLFAPTGQYMVETDDDYLAFRAVPLR